MMASIDSNKLIGLEIADAKNLLNELGISNFKFIYYTDRKQTEYDKEIVTAVRTSNDGKLEIIVCRYLFSVNAK